MLTYDGDLFQCRCQDNLTALLGILHQLSFLTSLHPMLQLSRTSLRRKRDVLHRLSYCRRPYASAADFPQVIGAGEARTSTPLAAPSPPWYKQHSFYRKIVNILLVASFSNSAMMILTYKAQKREVESQSKQRIRTLRETIEKVRKGEPIDIREALGTGDLIMEKSWEEGTFSSASFLIYSLKQFCSTTRN